MRDNPKTTKWKTGHLYLGKDNLKYLCLGEITDYCSGSYNYYLCGIDRYGSSGQDKILYIKYSEKCLPKLDNLDTFLEHIFKNECLFSRKTAAPGVDLGNLFSIPSGITLNEIRNQIVLKILTSKTTLEIYQLKSKVSGLLGFSDKGNKIILSDDLKEELKTLWKNYITHEKTKNSSLYIDLNHFKRYFGFADKYNSIETYFKDILGVNDTNWIDEIWKN